MGSKASDQLTGQGSFFHIPLGYLQHQIVGFVVRECQPA